MRGDNESKRVKGGEGGRGRGRCVTVPESGFVI